MTPDRSPSLTLRLTVLFALASASVMFLLGLLIGIAVERHFEEQDIAALSGKMQLVRHILERLPERNPREVLTRQLGDALTGHHELLVTVHDGSGGILYANTSLTLPDSLTRPAALPPDRPIKWIDGDGQPWRGIATTVERGAGRGRLGVVIATEIAHHEHFMTSFRQTLWEFVGLATLTMGLLGWIAVRRGLRPLSTIRRRAAGITADQLHTRIPVESIPAELAELARTLNDMLSRLEESFRRLSNFSSDLAHELRTPLSNLQTQTQVTLSKARSADDYRSILESNAEEFERLSRTVSDMLFLAKAENSQVIPNREAIELAAEVGNLLEYYAVLADDKGISVSFSGKSRVTGDRLMLRRAVGNLLSNAFRHTPAGGRIVVLIEESADHMVRLSVENTGSEIAVEHQPRLFDRFYRIDSSRQRTTESSGLGLAITKSIVEAHGGSVGVLSRDGITRFTLNLPAA